MTVRYVSNGTSLAAWLASCVALAPGLLHADHVPIDIPAQPLSEAVAQLGRETGIQVGVRQDLAKGRHSAHVSGVMTPLTALEQMLEGTGLRALSLGPDGMTVMQNAEGDTFDLGTLVLRGELRDFDLQDSPTSATIETGESIERRGDKDVRDVIRRTAGVNNSQGDIGVAIRGVDQLSPGLSARSSGLAVSTQIDGVALPSSRSTFFAANALWDIEQVEILRGPQSTQ